MPYPNVLIAGAPKCGTSSLFRYLADHPEVCPSVVKETHYLIDRQYPTFRKDCNYYLNGMTGYRRFFSHCSGRKNKVILEATPHYIYQETPLKVLPALKEIPRTIFILRKPSDRVFSLFNFVQNNTTLLDKKMTFPDFVAILRESGHEMLRNRVILGNAIEHSKYVNYLVLWEKAIGRNNILVLLLEDLRGDALNLMKRLSRSLGIEASFYDSYGFQIKNVTPAVRSRWLNRLSKRLRPAVHTPWMRQLMNGLYRRLNIRSAAVQKTIRDVSALADLESEFRPYNEALARQFSLDLTYWQFHA